MNIQYELRPVMEEDFEFLFQLHETTLRDHIAKTYGVWDEEDQRRRSRNDFEPGGATKIIVVAGVDCGLLSVTDHSDGAHVSLIEIAPEYQGKGLGSAILRDLIARERARRRAVRLGVFKVNARAKRFYERLGFKECDETETHFHMEIGRAQYALRPVTENDFYFLFDLYEHTLKEYVAKARGWDEEDQRRRFRKHVKPGGATKVIVMDGQDCGAIRVEEREDCVYLCVLEIAPERQCRGLGSAVLRDVIADARSRARAVALKVLKVNPRATRFYARHGFRVTGETETHFCMEACGESSENGGPQP